MRVKAPGTAKSTTRLPAKSSEAGVARGAPLSSRTKSLAFALTYQAADRTLTDKEIDKAHQKIEGRLRHVLKAQIRGKDAG